LLEESAEQTFALLIRLRRFIAARLLEVVFAGRTISWSCCARFHFCFSCLKNRSVHTLLQLRVWLFPGCVPLGVG
jgi:hypothetical protein